MRTKELQQELSRLGFNPGPIDGIYGEKTENACFAALAELSEGMDEEGEPEPAPAPDEETDHGTGSNPIPTDWLPDCTMERIICHWTAGAHKASSEDKSHYHILIEDDGKLIRGTHSIKDNVSTSDGTYAAHTKNCNTGSIGVSLCCMANAVESPFNAGKYPMTEKQFNQLTEVLAQLCERYKIKNTPQTVLSHAEVQGTLGIAQDGKWDYTHLPFDPSIPTGAKPCGDYVRKRVGWLLEG